MSYYSDDETNRQLKKLEKKIAKEYSEAYSEMKETADKYFRTLESRYKAEYKAYEEGKYTKEEFDLWYKTQVQRGLGYIKMRDDLASQISQANLKASAYINGETKDIYDLNKDYEAYKIYNSHSVDFQLADPYTVKTILTDDTNVVEFKTTKVNPERDYEWNRELIQHSLTSAILQGKSIDKLSDSFLSVMKRNRASAIRNARTSFTSAQNAGRQASYNNATKMGIKLQKEWIATLDERTRISHGLLDGKRVAYDKKFSNGLMYPADSNGSPAEVYNCRCTMRAVLPNVNDEERYTYQDWKREQDEQDNGLIRDIDNARWNIYNKLKHKTAKEAGYNTLSDLPTIKNTESYVASRKNTNPNYYDSKGKKTNNMGYTKNCQRCVVAYEMRARNYDVKASYRVLGDNDEIAKTIKKGKSNPDSWLKAFENGANSIKHIPASNKVELKNELEKTMIDAGENARGVIRIQKEKTGGGHVFNVVNVRGTIKCIDAQSQKEKTLEMALKNAKADNCYFIRTDTLKLTDEALELVEI